MTVRVQWKMDGFGKYLEDIAKAGQNVDAACDRAVSAGGDVILAGMQERVHKLTGNLEANLECTAPAADGNFHYIEVGMRKGVDADTARYGNAQEYGGSKNPPNSYIRAGFDEKRSAARAAMRDSLKKDGVL
jgi:HK97 gp10 family phage protein